MSNSPQCMPKYLLSFEEGNPVPYRINCQVLRGEGERGKVTSWHISEGRTPSFTVPFYTLISVPTSQISSFCCEDHGNDDGCSVEQRAVIEIYVNCQQNSHGDFRAITKDFDQDSRIQKTHSQYRSHSLRIRFSSYQILHRTYRFPQLASYLPTYLPN
jgi:hypothetical protein